MSTRFLPTQESVLDTWLQNFSTKISAAPAVYGLSAGDAAVIAAQVASWGAAFLTAASPATRTTPTVQAKRDAKKSVVAVVRAYAAKVRVNDKVSDELKLGLGLKLRRPAGSPVPAPASKPVLGVRGWRWGEQDVFAFDDAASGRRGKPQGVSGLMVFRAVADGMVNDVGEAQFLTLATRLRFTSTFTAMDRGKTATYFARWVNTKGEAGPWSIGMSAPIAA